MSVSLRLSASATALALLAPVALAQGSARVVNGTLFIDAGPGSVQVKVTVGLNGNSQVFDVPGLPSPIDFQGVTALDYRSGPGNDKLQLEVQTRTSFPAVIRNPVGESELDLKYRVETASQVVDLTTILELGTGSDLIAYEVVSVTDRLRTALLGTTGEGSTDLFATIDAPDPAQLLDATVGLIGGSSRDQMLVDVRSGAALPSLRLGMLGGGGGDLLDLAFDQNTAAFPLVGLFGDLGLGDDTTDLRLTGSLATYLHYGSISGGAGIDQLQTFVDTDLISIGTFEGGAGDDRVDALITGGLDGAPILSGGDGNDLLVLDVEGNRGGVPTLDGGAGFDVGIGYGRFVSIESRN